MLGPNRIWDRYLGTFPNVTQIPLQPIKPLSHLQSAQLPYATAATGRTVGPCAAFGPCRKIVCQQLSNIIILYILDKVLRI